MYECNYYIDEDGTLHIIGEQFGTTTALGMAAAATALRQGASVMGPNLYIDSYADNMRLRRLPDDLRGILGIKVRCAPNLTEIPALPANLCSLELIGCPVRELPVIPATVCHLGLSGTALGGLPPLPAGLRSFGISCTRGIRSVELPDSVQRFAASSSDLEGEFHFGPDMVSLDLSFTRTTAIEGLSTNLVRLDLTHTDVEELPDTIYQRSLKYLNISYTKVTRLPDVERLPNLQQLDVRNTVIPDGVIDGYSTAYPNLIIIR